VKSEEEARSKGREAGSREAEAVMSEE